MASKKYLDLIELSDEDLTSELEGMELDYQKKRFDHAAKGLDNPLEIKEMRRDIARIKTEVRRREVEKFSPEQVAKRSKIRARRRIN